MPKQQPKEKKPKQITAKKKNSDFTDVQVRIHNTLSNIKQPLVIPFSELEDYVDQQRKSARDWQGKPNWQKFTHLPFLAFVDVESKSEVVFKKPEDLPKEPCDIVTNDGVLIAKLI